jgi:hypothetical protein
MRSFLFDLGLISFIVACILAYRIDMVSSAPSNQQVLSTQPDSQLAPADPDSFAVHVFIQHDQYLASVFLPSLFTPAAFPDDLWKRPPVSPYAGFADPADDRFTLGRYVFPTKLSSSTRLTDVAQEMTAEFHIEPQFQAYFTIFPPLWPDHNYKWPEWRNKPLPEETTLAEVYSYDPNRVEGKVHLVLRTKAAAVAEITGTAFLEEDLGTVHRILDYRRDDSSYADLYRMRSWDFPAVIGAVEDWRHAHYALQFLRQEKNKLTTLFGPPDSASGGQRTNVQARLWEIDVREREKETMSANARVAFQRLVRAWDTWVLGKPIPEAETEMADEDVEPHWEALRQSWSEIVDAWKGSERRQGL